MSNTTTTSVLSPAVREYYDRLVLMTAYPKLVFTKFGQKRILPKNSGDTIVFRRYSKLAPVTVPITDGIVPPGAALSTTDLKARVDYYGNYVRITDQVQDTVEDRVLNQATRLLAQNQAETMDRITRDVLASTSSVLSCSNGSNGNTPTELTKEDIDSAIKSLVGNDAEMISEVIPGTDSYASTSIRPAFFGYIHTDLLNDLEKVAGFVSPDKYGTQGFSYPEEWGATSNVRWLYSSVGIKSSAGTAVYGNIIVGKEAYGLINLGSESGEFYVKPMGSAGTADPLNQFGTVGFKHPFVARILNDSFMTNLQSTAA